MALRDSIQSWFYGTPAEGEKSGDKPSGGSTSPSGGSGPSEGGKKGGLPPTGDELKDRMDRDRQDREAYLNQDPKINTALTDEEKASQRERDIKNKLKESAKGTHNRHGVTADSIFGPVTRTLLNDNESQELFQDGLTVGTSRRGQTAMLNTKFTLGNPQAAGWEVELAANGFADMTQVSYASQGRWGLMHQRQFKSGGMVVGQFMLQPQAAMMGGPPGGFVGVLRYPWMHGQTSQLQYVRGQHMDFSHCARLYRGLTVSAAMNYDFNTHASKVTYQYHTTNDLTKQQWFGKYVPSSGEWVLATHKKDWASDTEMAIQLECTEKRMNPGVKGTSLNLGLKKPLVGGGSISAAIQGFQRLKASVELPFGAGMLGMPKQMRLNQVTFQYSVMYDIKTGGAKQGINLTF